MMICKLNLFSKTCHSYQISQHRQILTIYTSILFPEPIQNFIFFFMSKYKIQVIVTKFPNGQ